MSENRMMPMLEERERGHQEEWDLWVWAAERWSTQGLGCPLGSVKAMMDKSLGETTDSYQTHYLESSLKPLKGVLDHTGLGNLGFFYLFLTQDPM